MGRVYTAHFNGVAVGTAEQDIFELNAPSDAVVELMEIHCGQTTDFGDAEEEIIDIILERGATTSGSGGTTVTAVGIEAGDPAFGGTVEANNTTQASGGTISTVSIHSWNVRVPLDVIFQPESRPVISPSGRIVAVAEPRADAMSMSGYIVFREIGG